jgi:hypothetical protein
MGKAAMVYVVIGILIAILMTADTVKRSKGDRVLIAFIALCLFLGITIVWPAVLWKLYKK